MLQRRELLLGLREQVMQTKTGQVLQEGRSKLAKQLGELRADAINPQLERVQQRGKRLLTRLATDRKMKGKAEELLTAAQARLTERWRDPNDPWRKSLEDWVAYVREHWREYLRSYLRERLGGLKDLQLEQLDLRQLVANSWDPAALEAQLQRFLVRAVKFSGVERSGTELLDKCESASSLAQISGMHRAYQGILCSLGDLKIEVPIPVRRLLEAVEKAGSGGDWRASLVSSLDDETVVQGASKMVEKGESMLKHFQEYKSSSTLASVMDHLDNEDVERELLKKLHEIDPQELMKMDLTRSEQREMLVSRLKDACLDFILKILPAINIDKVSGSDHNCDWEISDISFSDFSFRKENVHLALGSASGGEEILRLSAWDISAHFRNLKVSAKQTILPYLEAKGVADAIAEHMSVTFAFAWQKTPPKQATAEGGTEGDEHQRIQPSGDEASDAGSEQARPQLTLSYRTVVMEKLELSVKETNYAVIVNGLCWLFEEKLRHYACRKIEKHLDEHMGGLTVTLNTMLGTCLPLISRFGITLPSMTGKAEAISDEAAEEPSPAKAAPIPASAVPAAAVAAADAWPDEIYWADPGRTFAVRV
jgi:hypothetical protein